MEIGVDPVVEVDAAGVRPRGPGCFALEEPLDELQEQTLALAKMGREPLLDLDMRLGEGSGAVAAVPIVRSASTLLRGVALLSELGA